MSEVSYAVPDVCTTCRNLTLWPDGCSACTKPGNQEAVNLGCAEGSPVQVVDQTTRPASEDEEIGHG